MRVELTIKTNQDGVDLVPLSMRADYIETETEYLISYIESTYDNLITIDKQTGSVIVEKKSSMPREVYYSKLVFEKNKKNKCSIDIDDYTMFVDIETVKLDVNKQNTVFTVKMEYYINGALNNVEIILE